MKKTYIETYGCQMNEYDSELLIAILRNHGYEIAANEAEADVILFNTCAIRENAHEKIYGRLGEVKHLKQSNKSLVIGLLGCMAQNLRGQLDRNDNIIDIFAGPDSYKRLPAMIAAIRDNRKHKQYDFSLSEFEDYSDIYPKRVPGVNAWIAVMRGCDNFCSFCVVPYTRGRERTQTTWVPPTFMSREPSAWGRNPFSRETGRISLFCLPFFLILNTITEAKLHKIKDVVFFLDNQYSCWGKYCHREESFLQITLG